MYNQWEYGSAGGIDELKKEIQKLKEQNEKLLECVQFYSKHLEVGRLGTTYLIREYGTNNSFVELSETARKTLKEIKGE